MEIIRCFLEEMWKRDKTKKADLLSIASLVSEPESLIIANQPLEHQAAVLEPQSATADYNSVPVSAIETPDIVSPVPEPKADHSNTLSAASVIQMNLDDPSFGNNDSRIPVELQVHQFLYNLTKRGVVRKFYL